MTSLLARALRTEGTPVPDPGLLFLACHGLVAAACVALALAGPSIALPVLTGVALLFGTGRDRDRAALRAGPGGPVSPTVETDVKWDTMVVEP